MDETAPMPTPTPASSPEEFGMNEEDLKRSKAKNLFETIKFFFAKIEPTVVQILSAIIYYTLRFIKAFVSSLFRMVLGREG